MKRNLKNVAALLLICLSVLTLVACGSTAKNSTGSDGTTANVTTKEETTKEDTTKEEITDGEASISKNTVTENTDTKKTLVAYFSATGTTKTIAGYISTVTGGTLYEIIPQQPYSTDDLNYSNSSSRSTTEQNNKSTRPAISGTVADWDSYDVVFIGYPIWWGEEPRIIDTFVEQYNFQGKTVIPFCTSASSGVGSSDSNMKNLSKGTAAWLSGKRIESGISHQAMCDWVNGLGLGYNAK